MIDVFIFILIGSMFSIGLSLFSVESEPFHWFYKIFDKIAGESKFRYLLFKPVIFCYVCMGWFYTSVLFTFFKLINELDCGWWWLPVAALASSTLNAIIGNVVGIVEE